MDFSIPEDARMAVDGFARFVERELLPAERLLIRRGLDGGPEWLQPDELADLQRRAGALGFWGIDVPAAYGGADLDPVLQSLLWMEVGRSSAGFRFGGTTFSILVEGLDDAQRAEYLLPTLAGTRHASFALSEPGVGSDARGMRTTAVRDGDDWIVDGEKTWISGGNHCDFTILFARTPTADDPEGISAFLVDRAMGFTSTPIPLMGRAPVASLHFDGVRVPDRNRIGEVGRGLATAMRFLNRNRGVVLSAKNCGAATRLLAMAMEHLENRSTFGRKLAERENFRHGIAECEIELRCSKLLTLNVAWRVSQGLDYRHASSCAKVHAARMANTVADRVVQVFGAMGYAREAGIERFYRDLRVERIYEGADEIQLDTCFRGLRSGAAPIGRLD